MILEAYVSNCNSYIEELRTALSDEEKDVLRKFLDDWTDNERSAWNIKYTDEIFLYVRATPHQRLVKKKWNRSATHRALLIYNAYNLMVLSYHTLKLMSEFPQDLTYRHQAAEAANFYLKMQDVEIPSFFDQ